MSMIAPFIHPARQRPRMRPLKAWHHMQKLIADKEDTEQVFRVIEALNGDQALRDFGRFLASSNGPGLLAERSHLPDLLDDHGPIDCLPAGTVGQAYLTFMRREGLSAAGLVAESEKFASQTRRYDDDLLWFTNRLRDTHDLYHVLTGYNRDALGEAALLAYTHSQHRGRGINFIVHVATHQITKFAPREANIKTVIAEGRRNGKAARRIIEQDIKALLREPLDTARARLGIARPLHYRRALKVMSEQGHNPALVAA